MSPRKGPDRRASQTGPSTREPRKRYYIFSPDLTSSGGYEFLNQDEALIDGRTAGRHEHSVPGSNAPFCTGAPPLREKPKLMLDADGASLLDLYGQSPRFLSSRAKALLADIDPEGFEFVECETVDRKGIPLEPYWLTDAIRIVNEFDEERSSFVRYVDKFPERADHSNNLIVALNDIYMSPNLSDSYHAFYFPRYATYFIVDDVLADAWRRMELTGVRFTPLQLPTEEEFGSHKEYPDHLSFRNYPYWTNREDES